MRSNPYINVVVVSVVARRSAIMRRICAMIRLVGDFDVFRGDGDFFAGLLLGFFIFCLPTFSAML
jgi:hypothetical protein